MSVRSAPVAGHVAIAVLLMGSALVLGGGGSPAPVPEMLLQCIAALALAAWVVSARELRPFAGVDRRVWAIAIAALAIPVLQLIPLPPFAWQAMAGRELTAASLDLVGSKDSWRPWSLGPDLTLAALLATVPPIIFLAMTASLGRGGRSAVMGMIAGISGFGLVLGAGQLAGGEGGSLYFYDNVPHYLLGFQANHGSTADMFLIGMVAALAALRDHGEASPRSRMTVPFKLALSAGIVAMFSLGVVLSASRAGMALLPLAWAACLWISWPMFRISPRQLVWAGAALLVIAAAIIAFSGSAITNRILGRFAQGGEIRPQIWSDTLFVVKQYFPWGAGMGNFIPVFVAAEPLEVVDFSLTNRAHNDYLELLVEAGVFGAMALAAIGWTVVDLLRRAWQSAPAGSRGQVVFSGTTLAMIALHSIVDYPLRSMSLAFVAAAAVALLMPLASTQVTRNADA